MQAIGNIKHYYLVRSCRAIPPEADVVGIGWDDIRFCDFPDAEAIIKDITEVRQWSIGRRANQIRMFKRIHKGDVVVVPFGGSAAIGVAVGEELHDPKYSGKDGCNQQRVRFLRDASGKLKLIARGSMPESLQKRLKIRVTIANLMEFKSDLDTVLSKLEAGESYSWSSEKEQQLEALAQSFREDLLRNIRTGKTGLRSGGIGLERLVRELLLIDGYKADILSKRAFPGHADADIKASKGDWLHETEFLIQVKHHDWTTGIWGQQQLLEIRKLMPDEYADYQLVLVTSGDVAEGGKEFAKVNDITVLDGRDLADWVYESLPKLSFDTKRALGIYEIPQMLM